MLRSAPGLAWLLVIAAACVPGGQKIGGQPSWRQAGSRAEFESQTQAPGKPIHFAPVLPASAMYNGADVATPPSSPVVDAVLDAVRRTAEAAKVAAPAPDARLSAAATELAAAVPEQGVIAYELVEFAMQHHGIIEPSPHLLVVWGPLDDAASIAAQLAPRIPELLGAGGRERVGVGVAKRTARNEGVVILAVQGSSVNTDPIPRALPQGGTAAIKGSVLAPYRDPEVFVTRDDGSVSQLPASGAGGAFRAVLDCGARRGRQQVEITAVDSSGSTVLANFPVWCGEAAPRELVITRSVGDDVAVRTEADAERALFTLLNRDRTAQGLPALAYDERVAAVARGHSREMRATGVVAHVSPTTGSAADRVRAAGLRTAAVLENVARAYGVGEAHAGLMNSPGHRANLLSTVATHVGIGVIFGDDVSGQREMFVTQVFTRVPPPVDSVRAAMQVREKVRYVRPLQDDPVFDSAAQQLAEDLARGMDAVAAKARATASLRGRSQLYKRIGTAITAVSDMDALTGQALLGDDASITTIGVGAAQGSHPDIGEGAIWVVLVMGEKR